MDVELALLGPVGLRRGGDSLALTARPLALLTRLAIAGPGRPVSAERLVEDLWRDRAAEAGIRALHTLVSRLRSTARQLGVPNPVVTSGNAYRLGMAPGQVDAVRFERLLDAGRAACGRADVEQAVAEFRAAEALWHGAALDDLASETWAIGEAARLDELRVQCVEDRIEIELGLGLHGPLAAELEALVEAHPLRERLWGQLMTALYYAGLQAEALRRYQSLRHHLSEELGLEPSPPLQELERRILQQSLRTPASPLTTSGHLAGEKPRSNLPAPVDAFVGRATDRKALAEAFTQHRLVSVVGAGGVGKTRLALEVARDAATDYPAGTWFVDLGDLDTAEVNGVDLIVGGLANALDTPADDGLRGVAVAVADGAFVVLDTCERHVEAAAVFAEQLLAAAPTVAILVTSREALRCRGEAIFRLDPLEIDEAVRLFEARSAAVNLGARHATDPALAVRVCEALDCLPLAIELASSRLGELRLEELADTLEEHVGGLGSRRGGPSRQRTLEDTVAWSTGSISPDELRVLRRLSVFAGGWPDHAVAAVCAGEGIEPDTVDDVVASLEGRSLVSVVGARRRLLDVVRTYAAELLDPVEHAAVADRHLAWVAQFSADMQARESAGDSSWRGAAYLEQPNVRVALAHAIRIGDATHAQLIASGQSNLWQEQVAFAEGQSWLRSALALGGSGAARCHALISAALFASRMADPTAPELADEAVRITDVDPSTAAEAWSIVAMVTHDRGGGSEVVDALRRAVELARQGDDASVQLVVSTNLGIALLGGEHHLEAIAVLEEAAAIEPRFGATTARAALADARRESGEPVAALSLLDEIAPDMHGLWELLQGASVRARCLLAADRPQDALAAASDAMAVAADADLALYVAFGALDTAAALVALGRADEAVALLQRHGDALRAYDSHLLFRGLADALIAAGKYDEAATVIEQIDDRGPYDDATAQRARLALRQGRPQDVATIVSESRKVLGAAGLHGRAEILAALENEAARGVFES